MSIYPCETSLLNGQNIFKSDDIIHFIGTADELNSHLGLIKALLSDKESKQFLEEVQKNIMRIMSHASDPSNEKYFLSGDESAVLEKETDKISAKLPELSQFILPGRCVTEAQIHITRTIARRAERLFMAVNSAQTFCLQTGVYLNKLSDYLFALSRLV